MPSTQRACADRQPPPPLSPIPPPPTHVRRAQLGVLYDAHGQRWAEIARHLEGRTDQQCMGRWRRHLDPSVKKDAWAVAEDGKLMILHDTLGPRWSNISRRLTGRTAQQCRARWFQISAPEEGGDSELSEAGRPTAAAPIAVAPAGRKLSNSTKLLQNRNQSQSQNRNRNQSRHKSQHRAQHSSRGRRSGTPPVSPPTPALTDELQQPGAIAAGGSRSNGRAISGDRGVGGGAGSSLDSRAGGDISLGSGRQLSTTQLITSGVGSGTSRKRAPPGSTGACAVHVDAGTSKRRKPLKDVVGCNITDTVSLGDEAAGSSGDASDIAAAANSDDAAATAAAAAAATAFASRATPASRGRAGPGAEDTDGNANRNGDGAGAGVEGWGGGGGGLDMLAMLYSAAVTFEQVNP